MFGRAPKVLMSLVECCGDYYYKPITYEENCRNNMNKIEDPNLMCYSHEDICRYAEDNVNIKFPLDGPLWTVFF